MNPQHQHELKTGLLRGLVWVVLAFVLLLVLNFANSAVAAKPVDRSNMLFPYYEVAEVLNSVATHHHAKDTAALTDQLEALSVATAQYCKTDGKTQPANMQQLQAQYAKAYLAWLELSSVVMGPMLDNNTVRQIDFRPLRLNLLERAIKKQPQGAQAMAMIGSPAKGFPALEYLFTQNNFKSGTPQCNYAHEVVLDIERTVAGLKWDDAQALGAGMQLYFNQLVGATHNLAWERMEKPLLKNKDEAGANVTPAGHWPFSEFQLTEKAWAAQWQGIEHLLMVTGQTVPQADTQVIPLEAYLRGLGKIELADTLVKYSIAVDVAMRSNDITKPASVQQSVKALKVLKGFLESEVAKGLKVSIQFSSSDGD
ncbi:imelysin family protein [Limnobacter sp. P1]|uniref:imelysin family protein n=2 Tax=Pseudomonadota TaxID=1224 RepID=UPI0023B1CC26|nr:imelysin family protein [Limnobacter sp. P1]